MFRLSKSAIVGRRRFTNCGRPVQGEVCLRSLESVVIFGMGT